MIDMLLKKLEQSFGISEISQGRKGLTNFNVDKDKLERLLRELRDRHNFSHLSFITVVDWIEEGQFAVVYMLHNYDLNHDFSIHVRIDRDPAEMESIHSLWAQAWTYQRELREMYGINFPGSPRLEEEFCLEGWDDMPPMRRDFNTIKYSNEQFGHREGRHTEDPRKYMQDSLYPNRGGDAK